MTNLTHLRVTDNSDETGSMDLLCPEDGFPLEKLQSLVLESGGQQGTTSQRFAKHLRWARNLETLSLDLSFTTFLPLIPVLSTPHALCDLSVGSWSTLCANPVDIWSEISFRRFDCSNATLGERTVFRRVQNFFETVQDIESLLLWPFCLQDDVEIAILRALSRIPSLSTLSISFGHSENWGTEAPNIEFLKSLSSLTNLTVSFWHTDSIGTFDHHISRFMREEHFSSNPIAFFSRVSLKP